MSSSETEFFFRVSLNGHPTSYLSRDKDVRWLSLHGGLEGGKIHLHKVCQESRDRVVT